VTTRPTLLVVAVVAATILIGCGPELPEPESPGAVLYRARCSGCHRLYSPGSMTADMWAVQVERMQREFERRGMAPLSSEELDRLLSYLRQHSLGKPRTD
jgi:hypothetical protein